MFSQAYAAGLPIAASDIASRWDSLYNFLVWLSVFFFILVVGGMIYFAVKFRQRPGARAKYITHNVLIEVLWTIVPLILLMVIFVWGYVVYDDMVRPPSDAMEVRVIGKQWLWQFQYDDGRTTTGEVFVPVNKPVKFIMTSEDVLHSFFIPSFRVKQDVVPGMYTSVWFEATIPGKHQVYCAEYCGTSHSQMLAQVVALTADQWESWKSGKQLLGEIPKAGEAAVAKVAGSSDAVTTSQGTTLVKAPNLIEQGQKLAMTRGCVACHSADGSKLQGPSWKGLYGHEVILSDGKKQKVDDNYIRESIENPNAKIVKGFAPLMPTYKGMVSELEMNALIQYIKSVK